MWNKRKLHLLLFLSLALSLVASFMACAPPASSPAPTVTVTKTVTVITKPTPPQIPKPSPAPAPTPTPTPTPTPQVIKDLAYIKASAWPYSDDADPEYEGVSIRIYFYDSKSELIFKDVNALATVKLSWDRSKSPFYAKQHKVVNTGEEIRIPFLDSYSYPFSYNPLLSTGPYFDVITVVPPSQKEYRYSGILSSWSAWSGKSKSLLQRLEDQGLLDEYRRKFKR